MTAGINIRSIKPPHLNKRSTVLKDRIFIKDKNRRIGINITDILYVAANRNYCEVVTQDKKHLLSVPLKTFVNIVNHNAFIRIHRSFLVNINKVSEIDDNYVSIKGMSFPISKSYKKYLLSQLNIV